MASNKVRIGIVSLLVVVGIGTTTALLIKHSSNTQPIARGKGFVPKSSWAFAGYGSPETALKTFAWAMSKGDITNIEAGMTPDIQEEFTKELKNNGQTAAEFAKQMAQEMMDVGGYRVLKIQTNTQDKVVLSCAFEERGTNGTTDIKMQRIDAEWKIDETPF